MSIRVLAAPSDRHAVGHCRVRWPVAALAAQGHDVGILEPDSRGVGAIHYNGRVQSARFPDCDVLVLQRPVSRMLVECIPFIQAKGTIVVCDFDDDLSAINPGNVAFYGMHPKVNGDINWRHAEHAARIADLVVVSTPTLAAKYGGHGRVRVLRNCVPDHYLATAPAGERWDGFGWAGAIHSHPHDLQVVGASAAKLERAGHEFRVVGSPDGVGKALGLNVDPPGTGLIDFDRWPSEVCRLSVGIAPLASTQFNASKSHWKLLEYLSLGVPWVASPTPEYSRLAPFGAMAAKPRDWLRELGLLLRDDGLRRERSEAGKAHAASLTYSKHCHEWAEAWADAVSLRRGSRSAV